MQYQGKICPFTAAFRMITNPVPPETKTVRKDTLQRRGMLLLYAFFVAVVILRMVYLIQRDGLLPGDLEVTLALQSISAPWFKNLMVAVSTFGWYPWSVLSVVAASLLVTAWLGFKSGLYLAGSSPCRRW
jgi:hypothetical protein